MQSNRDNARKNQGLEPDGLRLSGEEEPDDSPEKSEDQLISEIIVRHFPNTHRVMHQAVKVGKKKNNRQKNNSNENNFKKISHESILSQKFPPAVSQENPPSN